MRNEILALQKEMKKHGLTMYLVPTGDEHRSEYVSEYYKFRAYLSGFTGSAGTLLVTEDKCLLWTDGRYFVQAAKELENSGIMLMKSGEMDVPTILEYISSNIKENDVLGFDGTIVSYIQGKAFHNCVTQRGGKILDISLADDVWKKRPAIYHGKISRLDLCYAGCTVQKKLEQVRNAMAEHDATVHVLSTLDDIAWIFNLRGQDIPYNPVFYSYAVITLDKAILYVKSHTMNEELLKVLSDEGVDIRDYFEFFEDLNRMMQGERILLDDQRSSYKVCDILIEKNELIFCENPSILFKSIKNDIECRNIRKAHEADGLVMCRFIYWIKTQMLEREIPEDKILTECDVADYLDQLRLSMSDCTDLSFDTIAAYGPNAAMCHYSPDRNNPVELKPEGFFLVDCGGQYLTGTTDITRTIALGSLTEQQKRHYTLVLKGHIRLAMARFPKGICGANLDILARGPLWAEGLDFNHGTGHGVGYYLNVHEGPNNIHWNLQRKNSKTVPLQSGMLTSNEPGLYLEGEYGIRLENLILTKPITCVGKYTNTADCEEMNCDLDMHTDVSKYAVDDRLLEFETVTKAPFERDAVIKELLSADELDWLNAYHKSVYDLYYSQLKEDERIWLQNATAPL